MSRKVFFTIVVMILSAITGYFLTQLNSMAAYECKPYLNIDCDAQAQLACEGGDYFAVPVGSWCDGNTCRSLYDVYCFTINGFKRDSPLYCNDIGGCSGLY